MDSKNAIRYRILNGINSLNLGTNSDCSGEQTEWNRKAKDENVPTLVDILERNGSYGKLKIYQSDGTFVIGWQLPNLILGLYHQGDFYDGRFNHQD